MIFRKTSAFACILQFAFSFVFATISILLPLCTLAQNNSDTGSIATARQHIYFEKNGGSFFCNKPKFFDFLTHIPKDGTGYVHQSFQKKTFIKLVL